MDFVKEHNLIELLKTIEEKSNIKILHSVLVGSHSTGLERPDSKLDILLIYADTIEKYFDIDDHKQTTNVVTGNVVITAFSLKKAIGMIAEGNPAIHHLLNGKNKIISVPKAFRELEGFAKEFYNPQRMYLSLSKASYRYHCELVNSEDKSLKTFFSFIRLSLALHHCSCYGMIKQDFLETVRLSVLSDESKKVVYELVKEYKEGKSHTNERRLKPVVDEISKLTNETKFAYSLAPIMSMDKLVEFHIKTVLDISKKYID